MRKHNGMRPHDVAVLLKIITYKNVPWYITELAKSLKISQSEISESLNRNRIAKLFNPNKKVVLKNSLLEFLIYGIKYVFPVFPGKVSMGIVTAHSAKPISKFVNASDNVYVWACDDGDIKGQEIEPLYKNAVLVAREDKKLYRLLALVDAIRTGKAKVIDLAEKELKKRITKN